MDRSDQNSREILRRLASADAKFAQHERLTRIILFFLTFLATLGLGLFIGHIVGVAWLSHI